MSELSTIASLATAGGTLVLAVATFSATRSANRAARVSERALQAGLRPVLFNARPQDPPQKVSYVDDHRVYLHDGLAAVQEYGSNLYLSIPLRNVGAGLAVIHGWYLWTRRAPSDLHPAPAEEFRAHSRDMYVPAGDISFWQGAVRDREDLLYAPLSAAIVEGRGVSVDILYGDHEGGQRTITRFFMRPRDTPEEEPWLWSCTTTRHWNLDRPDPR